MLPHLDKSVKIKEKMKFGKHFVRSIDFLSKIQKPAIQWSDNFGNSCSHAITWLLGGRFFIYEYYHMEAFRQIYGYELSKCSRFQKIFAAINFRKWPVKYDFVGINFHKWNRESFYLRNFLPFKVICLLSMLLVKRNIFWEVSDNP